jgi:hypothetical protein
MTNFSSGVWTNEGRTSTATNTTGGTLDLLIADVVAQRKVTGG